MLGACLWNWCFDPCFPLLSVGRALLLCLRCEFQLVWRCSGAVMQVQHLLFFCYYLGSALHAGVGAVVAFFVHRMGRDKAHAIILPHPPHHLPTTAHQPRPPSRASSSSTQHFPPSSCLVPGPCMGLCGFQLLPDVSLILGAGKQLLPLMCVHLFPEL